MVGAIKGAEIWLSDRAKEDIDRLDAGQHKRLGWQRHDGVAMKGFPGAFTLWSVRKHPG
ncbi:MAG: hypothetical protein WAW52_10060 [Methanothrix sp.]